MMPESRGNLSLRGLWEVFLKPSSFFEELRERPKILVPYIVLAGLWLGMFFLLGDLILKMQMESPQFQQQMESSGVEMSGDMLFIMKMNTLVFGSIAMLLVPLLAAALALFFGNFVMAGKTTFRKLLSAMLYGEIVYAVGSWVVVPMVLAKQSLLVGLSLGFLAASQGLQSATYLALSKISVFGIWEIVAVGIGLSIMYGFSRNKGYLLAVLSMGLLSVLHVITMAISSAIV